MRPFFSPDRLWPDGHTRLHVYLHPNLHTHPQLAALIKQARGVLAEYPREVTLVPDEWLHLTVAAAPFEVDDLDHLRASLRQALHGLPPVGLRVGSTLATYSSVLLDAGDPDRAFAGLHARVDEAILRSTGRPATITTAPHLALAYGADAATVDSGRIGTALRHQCRPPHAPLTISEVLLVRVTQDTEIGAYTWDCLERYRLTPPSRGDDDA